MKNYIHFLTLILAVSFIACKPTCEKPYPDGMDLDDADANNIVMRGIDVVSCYNTKIAAEGNESIFSTHNGVKFLFSNQSNKALFDSNPEKYMPAVGGYCIVAAAHGKVEDVDNKHFEVYNGKLYFNRNEKAHGIWKKDKEGWTASGESMWPCLVAKNGRKI